MRFEHWPDSYRIRATERRNIVLLQYVQCAAILNEIFFYCPDTEWIEDGIGSCYWEGSNEDGCGGMIFDFAELRHRLRYELIGENSIERPRAACSYHKEGQGCVLGNLKAPKCLRYVASCEGLPPSFMELGNIEELFSRIVFGRADLPPLSGEGLWGRPEENWPMVNDFIARAKCVLAEVRQNYWRKHGRLPVPVLQATSAPLLTIESSGGT
jgi:hypothetical protein